MARLLGWMTLPQVLSVAFAAASVAPLLAASIWVAHRGAGWDIAVPLIACLGGVAAALIGGAFGRRIAAAIARTEAVAHLVADGDMASRVPEAPGYAPPELRRLADAFNGMLDEIGRQNRELAGAAVRAETLNRAKSEFLANMSHELRTPLNAIHGFSQIMRDEVFGPIGNARYKSYAEDISASAEHLIKVITDILDLSKAEAGMITPDNEPVAVPEIVDLAIRLTERRAQQRQVAVRVDLAPALAVTQIETDQGKLTQILLNLLSNSIKFTEPGGTITVIGRLGPEHVEIAVADTGIGIAEHDLPKVMTPFGQVASAYQSHEGFGLGLPLTKRLTEALGGSFALVSTLGVGTTATIRLPRFHVEPTPQELANVA